jgi:hypothetical protein
MTISSLSSTTEVYALQQQQQAQRKPPSMGNTAQLLGMSTDDLQSALKSGQTLDDLASSKGVSSTDLRSAIKSDIQANKPADAPDLSDDQLTQMATSIAAGKGPGGPHGAHHGHHHTSGGDSDSDATTADQNLATLASSLGVGQTDLLSKLTQGVDFGTLLGESSSTANAYTPDASTSATVDGGVAVDTYA